MVRIQNGIVTHEAIGGVPVKEYNKSNILLARNLRKNMTAEERKLWHLFLKTYPIRFRRQTAIGQYIVDFYCAKAKLVIEIDGTQHFEHSGLQADATRTQQLEAMELRVMRFSNRQINDEFNGVCQQIDHTISQLLREEPL